VHDTKNALAEVDIKVRVSGHRNDNSEANSDLSFRLQDYSTVGDLVSDIIDEVECAIDQYIEDEKEHLQAHPPSLNEVLADQKPGLDLLNRSTVSPARKRGPHLLM